MPCPLVCLKIDTQPTLVKTCQKLHRAQSYLHQELVMPTHFAFQNACLVSLFLLEKN
jgi:hypothetical protein